MERKQITVTVNGHAYPAFAGENLGAVLSRTGLLSMPCGGHGKCGKCRVTVPGAAGPLSETERQVLSPEEIARGIRLACRTTASGDLTVTIPQKEEKGQILSSGQLPDLALDPAFVSYGVAFDIGTTTVAARLYDKSGDLLAEDHAMNPQSAWGADVISRMEATMAGNAGLIAKAIRGTLDRMLLSLAAKAGISPEKIDGGVITGNTVMLHLLTETDVSPLSRAPFRAERLFGETVTAKELSLAALSPETSIYLPPCAAAFLGADVMNAALAAGLQNHPGTALLSDVGTNGEMILCHHGRLYACSTAAGPAFEGAGISMGMGAFPGAIDRVWLSDGEIRGHVIGDRPPAGLCGSGLLDAVACLLGTGAIDETGYLEDDPATILPPVTLTEADIRAVQLAKSAIHAGMRTLLHSANVTCDDVDTLFIAGGFGSYLDPKSAGKIGLFPEELIPRVRVIGNAALAGAAMLLLSREMRPACAAIAKETRIVDLAASTVFAAEFMDRMFF